MARKYCLILCLLAHVAGICYCIPDFSYDKFPQYDDFGWQGICKSGQLQSPVNIDKSKLKFEQNTAHFDNYNKYISGNISHEHHTIKFTFNNTEDVRFVSDRKIKYQLHSMHFHWGCTEHSIDNKSYSMELHLVHYNPKIGDFKTVEEFSSQGLSVVGVLFEQSEDDNPVIDSVLHMIENRSTKNKKINYRDLLPSKLEHVYQYSGSLTTPPCKETVVWHVLNTRSNISRYQLAKFRVLVSGDSYPNCRQTKPLNGRKITSIKVSETSIKVSDSAAHSVMLKSWFYARIWIFVLLACASKYLLT